MLDVAQLISRSARWHHDRVAVVDGDRRCTFGEVETRSNRLANALRHLNPEIGARVALLLPNRLEFIESDFAIAKAGKVKVPINPRLSDDERTYILSNSGADTLIVDAAYAEFVSDLDEASLRHIILVDGDAGPHYAYESLLADGADRRPQIELSSEDPSFILYTSGTTGRPKGAVSSIQSRLAATRNMLTDEINPDPDDGMIHAASVSHGSGSKILAYFVRGARNILLHKFDPEQFFHTVEMLGGTSSFMVPTMIAMLLDSPARERYDLRRFRTVTYGGAPMAPKKLKEAIEIFGSIFVQVYGSCEAPHPVLVLRKHEHEVPAGKEAQLGSAGREVLSVDVRVVGQDGAPMATDQIGELQVRGDNVMFEYWNNPEATEEVFVDGYYRTGDLARRDEEGFIYIVDRERDMIISGGYNIYPAEVEAVLHRHPAVQNVAVIGVPDETWGESVKAFVVLRPGLSATETDLIDHCRQHLAGYKKPRLIEFRDALPRGSTGKILKRVLRDIHWKEKSRRVN